MTDEDLKVMRDEIRAAVKSEVNGKIDSLRQSNDAGMAIIRREISEHNQKHEADMEEIKPYMQFASGLGVLWKILLAVGSLAVAWATIKSAFPNFTISL